MRTLRLVTAGEYLVGVHNVTLTVAGVTTRPVTTAAKCPAEFFGSAGEACAPCPEGATCAGMDADPLALPGYYPQSRAEFVRCTPAQACVGGVTAADVALGVGTGCRLYYDGPRCSECQTGAYRLAAKCVKCPNTAWLLFLSFAIAIVAAVSAAVYLSKKRVNLAGLSVGVVRG